MHNSNRNNYQRNHRRIQKTLAVLVLLSGYSVVQTFSPPRTTQRRPFVSSPICYPPYSIRIEYNNRQRSTTALYASSWGIRSKMKSWASRIVQRFRRRGQQPRKKYQPGSPATYNDSDDDDVVNLPASEGNDSEHALPVTDDETLPETTAQSSLLLSTDTKTKSTATTTSPVDLTGSWKLVVNDAFLQQYQEYLTQLGQPFWVRSIALSIVGRTTEETQQTQQGESLWIKGTNVRGTWERTLLTTASNETLLTADGETVEYEAWWEGPVHVSWLRGVQKYGGGSFESRRYKNEENCLVCESTFHPDDANRETAHITWTFWAE